jgi:hypothetical protein
MNPPPNDVVAIPFSISIVAFIGASLPEPLGVSAKVREANCWGGALVRWCFVLHAHRLLPPPHHRVIRGGGPGGGWLREGEGARERVRE